MTIFLCVRKPLTMTVVRGGITIIHEAQGLLKS